MTTTHTQPAGCDLDSLRDLIANDGFAMSFQSMGQYRAALIAAARAAQTPQIAQHAETIEQYVPPQAEILADEAKLYRDLTGDAMALGFDGVPAALEALRTVRSQAPQGDTRQGAHTCTPADERALKALTAITERVALTYRICCGTAPKQSVGELLDVTIQMPEWEIVRATLQARAAQGAGTAPALIPIPQVRPVSPENSSWEDVDQVTFDRLKANGTYETRTLYAAHPAPISTAPVGATDPVQIVREAVRQLAESPRRKDSSYVEGMVVGANMCLVRLERVLGRAATHPAPVSTAPATTASASEPMYQAQFDGEYGSSVWHDVTEAAYHTFMPEHRRIVYRAPSRAADGQQGASRAVLLNEVADVLAEQNWRGDLVEQLRDAALARAPLPAQADGQAVDDALGEVDALASDALIPRRTLAEMRMRLKQIIVEVRAAQSRAQSDTTGESNG